MKKNLTIAQFNAAIQAEGIPLELIKRRAYLTFQTLPHLAMESTDEMVYAYNHLTPSEWRERALDFWNDIKGYVQAANS